jgi:hypothetical protein
MTADVTIPADVARDIAQMLRWYVRAAIVTDPYEEWADLLDPQKPLREAVAWAMAEEASVGVPDTAALWEPYADAALAVVRDCIAALPVQTPIHGDAQRVDFREQRLREAVLALFDGVES